MYELINNIRFAILLFVVSIIVLQPTASKAGDDHSLLEPECVIPPEGGLIGASSDAPSYNGDVNSILHGNCDANASIHDDLYKMSVTHTIPGPVLPSEINPPWQMHHISCERLQIRHDTFTLTAQFVKGGLAGFLSGNPIEEFTLTPANGTNEVSFAGYTFHAHLVGDLACLYASGNFVGVAAGPDAACGVPVRGAYSAPSEASNVTSSQNPPPQALVNPINRSLPYHCLPVPPMRLTDVSLDWGDVISDVCTEYDTSASLFRYPDDGTGTAPNRAFTGVVIQCVEETMNNIFTHEILPGETMYDRFVTAFRPLMIALLTLYIMVLGYPYMYGKRGIAQDEWHLIALRFALVVYLGIQGGMADILPSLQDTSKALSLIVMEAASGDYTEAEAARSTLEANRAALMTANAALTDARIVLSVTPGAQGDAAWDAAYANVRVADDARQTALSDFGDSSSYGYRYCDFRALTDPGLATYPADMEYMRLWDMIDCKISKVLGVGDNINAPKSPHTILLVMASIFTNIGIGLINFILVVMLTIFILLVIIRVVQVYLMASIGLVLLAYISPIVIPAILFNFTRNMFNAWISQIIAYVIQPVILFAFLGFLFSGYDIAMYGGNHHFVQMTAPPSFYDNKLCMKYKGSLRDSNNALCTSAQFENAFLNLEIKPSDLDCDDPLAMGCVIQKVAIKKDRPDHKGLGIRSYFSTISYKDAKVLFFGLIQMVLISYLAYAVLGLVEQMSVTLTNAAGGGATGLASVRVVSPSNTLGLARRGGFQIAKAPLGAAYGAGKRVGRLGARIKYGRKGAQAYDKAVADKEAKASEYGSALGDKTSGISKAAGGFDDQVEKVRKEQTNPNVEGIRIQQSQKRRVQEAKNAKMKKDKDKKNR
jgi:hypothetical protein